MFLEPLQRHLAVCSRADLPRMARLDPKFWNVISVRGPTQPPIDRRGFKQVHQVICHDVAGSNPTEPEDMLGVPRRDQIQEIFRFTDSIGDEPILVHCHAGVSRSTAVALSLVVRAMHYDGYTITEIIDQAAKMLRAIRPQAAPNPLILKLGLGELYNPADVESLADPLLRQVALPTHDRNANEELSS